jgi:hypothetical protein
MMTRIISLPLVAMFVLILVVGMSAQSPVQEVLERSLQPTARLQRSNAPAAAPVANPELTCTPAPCVLPLVNASGTKNVASENPIAINPKKPTQLLVGANDYTCANSNGFYTSLDGGHIWNHTCINALKGESGQADPIVAYDLKGNAFIGDIDANNTTSTIALEKSTDGGKTWSAPFPSVEYIFPPGGLVDKPWMQIDTNPKSPYANAIYISSAQFDANGNNQITVSNSHNGGQTWQTVAVAPEQLSPAVDQFTDVAIAAHGTVYVTWMHCTFAKTGGCGGQTATFYLVKSTNGGSTWTSPAAMFTATLVPNGCHCSAYGSLPNTQEITDDIPVIDVDNSTGPHKGNLYVVYYNWTGSYMQVRVATSVDGGNTWPSVAVAPQSDQHDQFFPWLNVSKNGVVGVSWLDRRNDPKNHDYEPFAAFSTDGGASFGTNYQLSQQLSNPLNDGTGGRHMGDYTGNAWAGPNQFYVSYVDTTTGTAQAFVGGVRLK